MMQFVAKRNGTALFVGGSAFTRDFIHLGEEAGMEFGVMRGPAGASTEKARVLDKNRHLFKGAIGMVKQVIKMQQEKGVQLFRDGVALDDRALEELYLAKNPEVQAMATAVRSKWTDRVVANDDTPTAGAQTIK
jgi:hypothetical protein